MGYAVRLPAAAGLALALTGPALSADCDCKRRVGLCQAEAYFDGARILFTSQTEQCSRILFRIDEHEAAVTIRQGQGSVAFAAPGAKAGMVPVAACYVCDLDTTRD